MERQVIKKSDKIPISKKSAPTDASADVGEIYKRLLAPRSAFQDGLKAQFGKKLRRAILERGWSQSEFARRCGLPRDSVSTYILGKTLPTAKSAKAMADVLGLQIDDFLSQPDIPAVSTTVKPSLDIQTLPGSPARARIQLDRVVRLSAALKIAEIIELDDEAANGN
jgi:transcriptional regulator with XRE-family HTH domain